MDDTQNLDTSESVQKSLAKSSMMMTCLVLISRLTGFVRTWAQAFTLGASMLASCYTVANNLPNLLYEVTVGGMLYTAFLPVYMSVKKNSGKRASERYVSNIFWIIIILMGVLTVLAFIFASPLIFTQSAGASEEFSFDIATIFFRFFCIEILLYPLSTLLSSILNAERKYFWGQAAPIFNNIIVIASFLIGYVVAQTDGLLGFIIFAVGNPLGVLVQTLIQIPAFKKSGMRIHRYLNLHDPSIKDAVKLGLPSLLITFTAAVGASVQSSCSLYTSYSGAAILYYIRVWWVLPASLFAVPVCTALFTELSDYFADGQLGNFKRAFISGTRSIMFTMVPFMMYLFAYSACLMMILGAGSFAEEEFFFAGISLAMIAFALPFYALSVHIQGAFGALHKLTRYAVYYCIMYAISCVYCIVATPFAGMLGVISSIFLFYFLISIAGLILLRREVGSLQIFSVFMFCLKMLIFGIIGSVPGLLASGYTYAHISSVGAITALLMTVVGGCISLLITYGLALLFRTEEAIKVKDMLFGKIRKRK